MNLAAIVFAAAEDGVDAGKAIACTRHRPRLARRRHRHRKHLRLDDPGRRAAAGARGELTGIQARLRAHRGSRLLRPHRRLARPSSWSSHERRRRQPADRGRARPHDLDAALLRHHVFSAMEVIFGPVQKAIDDRRDRIRQAIEEADKARAEARALLEEHRAMIQQARGDAEESR